MRKGRVHWLKFSLSFRPASRRTAQAKVVFVTTAAANIEVVQTAGQAMQMLTDQQLLDLFKGQPVALVTISPGERRLILLNDGEQPR